MYLDTMQMVKSNVKLIDCNNLLHVHVYESPRNSNDIKYCVHI